MTHKEKDCPICGNISKYRLTKGITEYYQCTSCGVVYSNALDNDNMVGGQFEIERNEKDNNLRVERVRKTLDKICDPKVLDFGCGTGYLVRDLNNAGFLTDGYDAYNPQYGERLPEHDKYNLVIAVEVIEHTASPYSELDVIRRCLKGGGYVIIETSFTDVADQEGIDLEEFFYISPEAGHSTIFSHHSLDVLMCLKGFKPIMHWNREVRAYQKR